MKKIIYILVLTFFCNISYGQNKLYKKAHYAFYSEQDFSKAQEIILQTKPNSKSTSLALEIEAKFIELANLDLDFDVNKSLEYLTQAKSISLIFRDERWTSKQIETGLNIAYKLKSYCENKSDSNSACYYKSKNIYESILAQDEFNWNANYNLGTMLYHRAVYKIKQLDYETDIFIVERTQDECIKLFFTALPYLKKAYELNPKEKIIAKSLSKLYLSLNDESRAKEYEKLYDR